jgi:hypothetical protein
MGDFGDRTPESFWDTGLPRGLEGTSPAPLSLSFDSAIRSESEELALSLSFSVLSRGRKEAEFDNATVAVVFGESVTIRLASSNNIAPNKSKSKTTTNATRRNARDFGEG